MKLKNLLVGAAMAATSLIAASANAAVITGPVLSNDGGGWTTTGIGFTANQNTSLVGFTFQNQGQADTVVLTNAAGTILDSISTPAGTPSDTVSVNWALSSGSEYWLLQTVGSNELYAFFGGALPSNADITIIQSGTFDYGTVGAAANSQGWGSNEYWAGFNDITTSAGGVPEPATWAMMLVGLGGVGAAMRMSRRTRGAAAVA